MVVGSMTVETDVLVIGSGPGGYIAALRAAQLGKDVMVVEKEKQLGGVCLRCGCIPTKSLIFSSNYYNHIEAIRNAGVIIKDYELDIGKMIDWKQSVVDKLSGNITHLFAKYGIEVIEGIAKFTSSNEVHIEGKSDVTAITFKKAIIATGSHPIQIPGFDFNHERVISSKDALALKEVPEELVIIGGGYIGIEMGTVYGKLGSNVNILEMSDSMVSVIEKDIVDVVAKGLKKFNVTVHTNSRAKGWEEKDGKAQVTFEKNGKDETISCDRILVVVGRQANSKDLGLENTSVSVDGHGFIEIDEYCKTKDEAIYAIGDVTGNPMLAHRASKQGKVAAEHIGGEPASFDSKVVPAVIFNDPEIASVGLQEQEAKDKGYEIMVGKYPLAGLGKAHAMQKAEGFIKVIGDKKTGLLLGVHGVGPHVTDIIGEATLAIEAGLKVEDIALTIHPHPTISEGMMEAAEAALDKCAHLYTPPKN